MAKKDAIAFAKFALNDPEFSESIQRQIDEITPTIRDEDREVLTGRTTQLLRAYMHERELDWHLRSGYQTALSMVAAVLSGRSKSLDDPELLKTLDTSPFIDCGD